MGAKALSLRNKKCTNREIIVVREFERPDELEVLRIFHEGLMEMVPDTAFRGLTQHPESLLLYIVITVIGFAVTMCWWVIGLLPAFVVCARYFYSRRVIHGYLWFTMRALHLSICYPTHGHGALEMIPADWSCLWVAVLDGKVVGVVAATGQLEESGGTVELRRMSVDRSCRRCGVGVALGKKVLEFAAAHGYTFVKLGTTAYTPAAHQLYQRLGFQNVGVTNGYITPGSRQSLPERLFYRVQYHHYIFKVSDFVT